MTHLFCFSTVNLYPHAEKFQIAIFYSRVSDFIAAGDALTNPKAGYDVAITA